MKKLVLFSLLLLSLKGYGQKTPELKPRLGIRVNPVVLHFNPPRELTGSDKNSLHLLNPTIGFLVQVPYGNRHTVELFQFNINRPKSYFVYTDVALTYHYDIYLLRKQVKATRWRPYLNLYASARYTQFNDKGYGLLNINPTAGPGIGTMYKLKEGLFIDATLSKKLLDYLYAKSNDPVNGVFTDDRAVGFDNTDWYLRTGVSYFF